MDEKERNEFFNSLYPEGEERWLKVRYTDNEKCRKNIRFENGLDLGFEFTAIGTVEQYIPQVSALAEIKEEIKSLYYEDNVGTALRKVENLINNKIDETLMKSVKKL